LAAVFFVHVTSSSSEESPVFDNLAGELLGNAIGEGIGGGLENSGKALSKNKDLASPLVGGVLTLLGRLVRLAGTDIGAKTVGFTADQIGEALKSAGANLQAGEGFGAVLGGLVSTVGEVAVDVGAKERKRAEPESEPKAEPKADAEDVFGAQSYPGY